MLTIIIILLFFIIFFSAKKQHTEEWLSKKNTTTFNGIFVIFVFLSHFCSYVNPHIYRFDSIYLIIQHILGQCTVCSFLFFSGYGIMEQIKIKGDVYKKRLVTIRLPHLWLRFAFCIVLYLILGITLGKNFSKQQILLSFLALDSIGNSAWYIFYMLVAYIIIFISFNVNMTYNYSIVFLFLCTLLYLIILMLVNYPDYYYSTALVLPFGVLFSLHKEKISKYMSNHYLKFLMVCICLYVSSFSLKHIFGFGVWSYNVRAICFTTLIILLMYKVQLQNKWLSFLGGYVFEIYILQRLPMIYFEQMCSEYMILYLIICISVTFLLAIFIKKIFLKLKI